MLAVNASSPPFPSDIRLLLRAHGEQRWLLCQVAPMVATLEQRDAVGEEQLGAALAYLEDLWIDAHRFADQTDCAYARLEPTDDSLHAAARRYRAAVRRQRAVLATRVAQLLGASAAGRWSRSFSPREHAGF
jgi:hypothetical protein